MPKYSTDFIRKVSEANDIVDVISDYVPLKQKGNTFSACCPFHNEKTPSFHVNRDKQLYHCFGCGAGGDIYKFLMEKENMDFSTAVKFLADRAGIPIPSQYDQKKMRESENRRSRLIKINESAANYYYKNLIKNAEALNYLKQRGFGVNEIKTFGLGLAPNSWTAVLRYLTDEGYSVDEIIEAGLAQKNHEGSSQYDRFRNRITFPIQNVMNRVIGFGARKIDENDQGPKYLNSPETELFKKGSELFNLNRAKRKLKENPLILVEGYMDVIALNKYGLENVAAALGTSFTEMHSKLISRYTKDVILCFDGDEAGEKATIRALDVLEKNKNLNVRIIRLPVEHDPDSFIQEFGTSEFRKRIESSQSILDFKIALIERGNNLNTSRGIIDFVNQSLDLLTFSDPIEKDYYIKIISNISGIDEDALKDQLNHKNTNIKSNFNQNTQTVQKTSQPRAKIPRELKEAQIVFLLFAYENPNLLLDSEVTEEMMTPPFFKWFYKKLCQLNESEPDILAIMSEEERSHFENGVKRLLIREREKIDTADKTLLEKSITAIKKYNRRNKVDQLSSQESLLLTDDEQKRGLISSIIKIKKVDF